MAFVVGVMRDARERCKARGHRMEKERECADGPAHLELTWEFHELFWSWPAAPRRAWKYPVAYDRDGRVRVIPEAVEEPGDEEVEPKIHGRSFLRRSRGPGRKYL